MKAILLGLATMFLSAGAHAALPGDAAQGKRLHDAACTECHDTKMYSRKDRVVRSLSELEQQLDGCSHMAKKKFTPAQTRDLLKYLNDGFYRFE